MPLGDRQRHAKRKRWEKKLFKKNRQFYQGRTVKDDIRRFYVF
ncbi:hypothetical protein B4168_2742 [Anoxybacillus flavithermus]|nr:hypothetical protein B4168_2742 [Anoxybacillus flavithermus]OAO87508.1 hypothetical protein GT23_1157 [Parageobacillus thermoglucosidasius]